MKNYKELVVWQNSMIVVERCYELVSKQPKMERYGLGIQATKAAVSIASNIAEGSSRSSDNDYARFLEISLGSSFELETQITIIEKVYLEIEFDFKNILEEITLVQKMLASFISTLRASS